MIKNKEYVLALYSGAKGQGSSKRRFDTKKEAVSFRKKANLKGRTAIYSRKSTQ